MSISLEPLSRLPAGALRQFLTSYGHAPAVIDWKYFDRDFNGERERGFACVQDGAIVSFLGLQPFQVVHNGRTVQAAWSCDWYRDPQAAGPLGLLLIRQSLQAYPWVYSLGGSEATKTMLNKLARLAVPAAAVELYKPLRLGGAAFLLQKAAGWSSAPPLLGWGGLPLPARPAGTPSGLRVEWAGGLPSSLATLPEPPGAGASHRAAYSSADRRWLLERCPAIAGLGTALLWEGDEMTGALLYWHAAGDRRFWRLALLPGRAGVRGLSGLLRATVGQLRRQGAWLVSLLAAGSESDWLGVARRQGFRGSQTRRPLYVLTRDPADQPQALDRLSYLDTDYAYRFPTAPGTPV